MTVPPTGTVTFLFTDIEGSTKLWERNYQAGDLERVHAFGHSTAAEAGVRAAGGDASCSPMFARAAFQTPKSSRPRRRPPSGSEQAACPRVPLEVVVNSFKTHHQFIPASTCSPSTLKSRSGGSLKSTVGLSPAKKREGLVAGESLHRHKAKRGALQGHRGGRKRLPPGPPTRRAKAPTGGPPLRPPRACRARSSRAPRTSFQALPERVLSGEFERMEAAVVSQILSVGLQENLEERGRERV
jgi:hypothetical protein